MFVDLTSCPLYRGITKVCHFNEGPLCGDECVCGLCGGGGDLRHVPCGGGVAAKLDLVPRLAVSLERHLGTHNHNVSTPILTGNISK